MTGPTTGPTAGPTAAPTTGPTTGTEAATRPAWRFFDCEVAAVGPPSPSYVRLTLRGPALVDFADNGWDQRFKLVLPDRGGGFDALPRDPDWHATWRRLPDDLRNPIRTYTVRAVRHDLGELDVDVVRHGDVGPASRFAGRACPGDRLVVLGPDRGYGGPHGGLEFRPPATHLGPTLLVGDATAVPAVLAVLERLPAAAFGEVVLEVPHPEDIADVVAPVGFRLTWLVRQPSSLVPAAVDEAAAGLGLAPRAAGGPELPPPAGEDLLWEVPEDARAGGVYAWVAGEASLVARLRRRLVRDLGVDRRSVAFMGYWREGRPGG